MTGALQSLSYRNVRGNFFMALERGEPAWVPMIADMVETDQPTEIYKHLGNAPILTKWTGERKRKQLTDAGITVVSEKYEATIEADVDDVRRDKTGQYLKRVRDLGKNTGALSARLLTAALLGNGTAYDGSALYSSHTKFGSANNVVSASATSPDTPTSAEFSAAVMKAIQTMFGFTDENGEPLNESMSKVGIMVPVKYWSASKAALKDDFTSAGVSNTLPKVDMEIVPWVNGRLTGTAAAAGRRFFVFRLDADSKPMLFQEDPITDRFKEMGADSEGAFYSDKVAHGAKRIGAASPMRFELTARVEFS